MVASRPPARREHQLVRFLILGDLLALVLATALALGTRRLRTTATESEAALWAVLTVLCALFVFSCYRLYERDRQHITVSALDELKEFLNALTLVCFLELSVGQLVTLWGWRSVGPGTVLVFWLFAVPLVASTRGLLRHVVIPALDNPQNTVIVGAGHVGQTVARKIRKHPEYNLRVVGFLDDEPHPLASDLEELSVLGGEKDLVTTLRRYRASRVILAFSRHSHDHILDVIRGAGLREVHLSIVPRYFEIMASNAGLVDVDGIPVLEIPAARLSRLARVIKRSFDLALTVPGLIVISPLLAIIAAAIKLESPGPVFFRQLRRGRNETVFRIYKFRTMVDGAERGRESLLATNETTGPLFKMRDDPRVTRVGRILRALSLDELPQLLNVLKGEMSLVGPRPFVVYEDEKIDGWARRRLDLTPGITGVWQVLGRHDLPFEEMVKLDYLYVSNWSLWWDVKLLLQTVPIVVLRRGY